MKRNFFDYFILTLKGMAMGAADVVPGVSGGTIAFISGIYEELIHALSTVNLSTLKFLKSKGLKATWKYINGNFLVALFLGVILSILTLSKLVAYLLEEQPILLWAFFFGLVVASIIFVLKKLERLNFAALIGLIFGGIFAYQLTQISALSTSESVLYLFFSGAIAICAMILPGISGAFILVILGSYTNVIQALNNKEIDKILIFVSGAIVGILSFSKLLKWLFNKHKNFTLAVLTGFMIGALTKIWPWKKVLNYRINSEGINVPFNEECVLPFAFDGDPQLLAAIGFMLFGFFMIIILEKISSNKVA